MNNLSLNLLPNREKTESSLKWRYFVIKNFILLNLTVTIAVALVLVGAKLALVHELEQAKKQSFLVQGAFKKINKEISFFNKKLAFIESVQKEFVLWPPIIYDFLDKEIRTNNISIREIKFDTNDNTLTINGVAPTRNDLIALRDSLKKNKMLENVDVPLVYLLKKRNINFNLTASFKLPE